MDGFGGIRDVMFGIDDILFGMDGIRLVPLLPGITACGLDMISLLLTEHILHGK